MARDGDEVQAIFRSARWYDKSIDWDARLGRELPVLIDVMGRPGEGGLLDAGCGTGRQALALSKAGHRLVGADASEEMLEVARGLAEAQRADVSWVVSPYDQFDSRLPGGFDGLFCLGNALAAVGSREGVRQALAQFAGQLRPGGRLFVQVLNFTPLREETPCIRGPRVVIRDGATCVSVRHFVFGDEHVEVTNITLVDDGGWRQVSHQGRLYPVSVGELRAWCEEAGLRVDELWGRYDRSAFDESTSPDLIVVATRR